MPESNPSIVTARLLTHPGKRTEFTAFEEQAFEIMRNHGAEIVEIRASKPLEPEGPDETHVLRFPSRQAFDSYRADPRLTALAPQRDHCITDTRVEIAEVVD